MLSYLNDLKNRRVHMYYNSGIRIYVKHSTGKKKIVMKSGAVKVVRVLKLTTLETN